MDWKDVFLNLYISDKYENHVKALEIKRKNIPQKLYRFRSLENIEQRLEEIRNGKIYLAHPQEQNDPYDTYSVLHSNKLEDNLNKELYLKNYKGNLTEEQKKELFFAEDWLDKLFFYEAKARGLSNDGSYYKKIFVEAVMPEVELLNQTITAQIRNYNRFACFTISNDNLPMWNHYADSHRGICLEYDTSQFSIDLQNKLFPVLYTPKLPDAVKFIREKSVANFSLHYYILMHKLESWSYENEWRLIYSAGHLFSSLDAVPKEFLEKGILIDFTKPSKILLGYSITKENENKLRKIGTDLNIPVIKMTCTEYGLKPDSSNTPPSVQEMGE